MGGHLFHASGRLYGACVGVLGRVHVVGIHQRGVFWRIGAKIYRPTLGYWESVFALRTSVASIELMAKVGMKDEIIPIRCRRNRIRGSVHFSRTGLVSMVITSLDREIFGAIDSKNQGIFATEQNDMVGGVQGREERY
jgi:hypothetical protein